MVLIEIVDVEVVDDSQKEKGTRYINHLDDGMDIHAVC